MRTKTLKGAAKTEMETATQIHPITLTAFERLGMKWMARRMNPSSPKLMTAKILMVNI